MAFSLRFAAHSEVGRVRKNNQDSGYASPTMLLVTDGMGGAAAGDVASAVAAQEAARSDRRVTDGEEMLTLMAGVIGRSNAILSALIEKDLELDGMGTTFCGAMFNGTQFGIGHVGDSRGYLLRDGELTQLTHDHSWVQSLIDEGRITPEQAATHPHRSLILKVLNGQVEFEPDLDLLDARLGDRIMFCSDGLSGLVDDGSIREFLELDSPSDALANLAAAANANGGHDNITIVLGDVVEQDDALDAREGTLVGAAAALDVPRSQSPAPNPPGRAAAWPAAHSTDHSPDEVARYAPQESHRRWPGIIIMLVAVALVIGGGAWGVQAYARTRYFVAADEGNVAIFNGLPGEVLGIRLSTLEERSDVAIGDLPAFYQRAVESSIRVADVAAGRATTEQLRALAERCVEVREERRQPSPVDTAEPTPSPSPKPTVPGLPTATARPTPTGGVAPGVPTFLSPPAVTATPTDSDEADPEAC